MDQPASVRLAELARQAAILAKEMAAFPDPGNSRWPPDRGGEDANAAEAFTIRLTGWVGEVRDVLGPYPERWAEFNAPLRMPPRVRKTRLLESRSVLGVYRQRLAALLHGWTD